ncbi:MAG: type II secretion system protein GspN [Candidatus Magnetomorum sp.]|nr:type II secretion system protein GspN [Candidatus Magnetomorum sp.]
MKTFLGYTLFAICVTVFMLYYQFPEEMAAQLFKSKMRQLAPELTIDLEKILPAFPPGIRMEGLTVDHSEMRLWASKILTFQPDYLSIFRLSPSVLFYCTGYDGEMKGDAGVTNIKNLWEKKSLPLTFNAKWRNIQLNKIDALSSLPYLIEGVLYGVFSYDGIANSWIDGTGTLKIIIENGNITLEKPILQAIKNIQFQRFDAEFSFKNKVIQLLQSNINGDIEGSLSGTISLHPVFPRSTINITGKIKPSENYIKQSKLPIKAFIQPDKLKNGIPVTITGSINRPIFNTM